MGCDPRSRHRTARAYPAPGWGPGMRLIAAPSLRTSLSFRRAKMKRTLTDRRTILYTLASLPGLRFLLDPTTASAQESAHGRDVIKELGVRSFINAAGT